ncbi:MAG TPA: hypothetical protein ENJ31_04695, partial [Anaerolineae bacterium]|nr:hypothetical protein [Anaerolineae bacterium]
MEEKTNPVVRGLTELLEGKTGGWILNVLIAVLVIASLLLPPVSAQERILDAGYTEIDSDEGGAVVDPDGMQVTLLPEGMEKDIKVKEEQVPMVRFLEGSAGKEMKEAAAAIPSHLQAKSPVYQVSVKGPMPSQVIVSVPIPNAAEPYETLSLYNWTGENWEFVPSQLIPEDDLLESRLDYVPSAFAAFQCGAQPPRVSAELPDYVSLPEAGAQALTELNPLGYYLGDHNDVAGNLSNLPDTQGQETYLILPTLRNWYDDGIVRSDLVDNMLVVPESRDEHIQNIVNLVVAEMYGGIDIDYRGINPDLREEYTDFITKLAAQLHNSGKRLTIHVEEPVQIAEDRWETGAYDWKALGRVVDGF